LCYWSGSSTCSGSCSDSSSSLVRRGAFSSCLD
jgi:hypothetical protein